MNPIKISTRLWSKMVRELRKRGRGERESGAFLLAKMASPRICRVICYDDLDDTALDTGIITFHAKGFVRLWEICQNERLKVLADVHTHPTAWVEQSWSDKTHPMVAQPGHISLIVPHYAQRTKCSLNGVGLYEYLGDHKWKICADSSDTFKITLL
jgi:hypothetical protein